MKDDDYIGTCNECGREDVEICPDTGWCNECVKRYIDMQDEYYNLEQRRGR